jgi:hypothetical protein
MSTLGCRSVLQIYVTKQGISLQLRSLSRTISHFLSISQAIHITFPAHEEMRHDRLLNQEFLLNPVLSLRDDRAQHPPYKSHTLSPALMCFQSLGYELYSILPSATVCIDMRENFRWSWENFHFGDLANYPTSMLAN